jgi:hypothetical protein
MNKKLRQFGRQVNIWRKNLTNKLYVKKKLHGLQPNKNTDLLEQLNKFNMSNTQLLNFGMKIEEEDKSILLLAFI